MSQFDEHDAFEAAAVPLSQRAMAARPAPYLDDLNPAQRAAVVRKMLRDLTGQTFFKQRFGDLARRLKAWPITVTAPRPVAEAISTAGGVPFEALDDGLMLKALPGVFCAGEMLDWEAPTGGYLLTACFASGRAAGLGMRDWLQARTK